MPRIARSVAVVAATAVAMTAIVLPAAGHEVTASVPAPTIVPFEQWAPASCPRPTGADVAVTDRVVVHHSHDPVARSEAEVPGALAEICRIHVARGFDTIGYHYVVDPWGTIHQARGRLPDADGRAPRAQPEGAHVHGSNPGATGVVFLGDHQGEPPTAAAVDAAVHLLAWLVEATGRDPSDLVTIESTGDGTALHAGRVEVEALAGHNATNATLCPGQHLVELLPEIRERVRRAVHAAGGSLLVTDAVRAAPHGVAHISSSGPILAAPPAEPPLATRGGVLGLLPTTLALAALLLLRPVRRRLRTAPTVPCG